MKLSKGLITLLVVLGAVLLVFLWAKNSYNSMVTKEEGVTSAWAQVENVYQRRADLIPNLVATVKGYAAHEQETLEGVVNARAKATQTTIDPANMTEESMKQFQAAQGELGSALQRLMVVVERYPDLKANQNFLELQAQLEGTENRITVARKDFIEAVKLYNLELRTMPGKLIAAVVHPEAKIKETFSASVEEQNAPKVKF